MRAGSWKRTFSPPWLVALLAGGAGGSAPVNLVGISPAFNQGYTDGCESAGARSPRRDPARYKTDADYKMGWNDGYSICAKRK